MKKLGTLLLLWIALITTANAQDCNAPKCVREYGSLYTAVDHSAMFLADLAGGPYYVFEGGSGNFEAFADGTAHLTGTVYNAQAPTKKWTLDVWFKSRMNYTTWAAMSNEPHYKDEQGFAGTHYLNWEFYTMDSGTDGKKSKITGLGDFAGWELYLTQETAGNKYTTQVGMAANDKTYTYGLSTWFKATGTNAAGEAVSNIPGDFNLEFCQECSGTAQVTVNAAPGTFTYSLSPAGSVNVNGSTVSASNLCPGAYTLTVNLSNGSVQTYPISISDDDTYDISTSVSTVAPTGSNCNGSAQIALSFVGGNNYTYTYNGGGTVTKNTNSLTISNLCEGNGSITINYGTCAEVVTFTVGTPAPCEETTSFCTEIGQSLSICPTFCSLNNSITYNSTNSSLGASVQVQGNCILYTPNTSSAANDVVTVIAHDNTGATETVVLNITIGDCNGGQIFAVDDYAQTFIDYPVSVNVLGNEVSPGGTSLTIVEIYQPSMGYATIYNGQIIYTPPVGYTGTVTFSYKVCDTAGNCDTATVTILVSSDPGVCNIPTEICLEPNHAATICPQNCIVPDATTVSVTSVLGATINILSGDCVYYIAPSNAAGLVDTVTINGCNAAGECAPVYAYITIGDCPKSLSAGDDLLTVYNNTSPALNIAANDEMPEGSYLLFYMMPRSGTLLQSNGKLYYTPNKGFNFGTDEFYYAIAKNGEAIEMARVIINVDFKNKVLYNSPKVK